MALCSDFESKTNELLDSQWLKALDVGLKAMQAVVSANEFRH